MLRAVGLSGSRARQDRAEGGAGARATLWLLACRPYGCRRSCVALQGGCRVVAGWLQGGCRVAPVRRVGFGRCEVIMRRVDMEALHAHKHSGCTASGAW